MQDLSLRRTLNRHVVWVAGVVVAIALIIPAAMAQDATPAATPGASPAATPGATPIASKSTIMSRNDPTLGPILTDSDGRTLYKFAQDRPGQSTCVDACAETWIPFTVNGDPELAPGVPGSVALHGRDNGVEQVVYNGSPLYYYAKDTQPGDTKGQGVDKDWSVVTPQQLLFGKPVAATPVATP